MTQVSYTPTALRAPGAYPWLIAIIGMFTLVMSNGLTQGALSVYDPALIDAFGWQRGALKLRDVFTQWPAAFMAPAVGLLIDRFNPKYLLMFGMVCLSIGLFGYSFLSETEPTPIIHLIAVFTLASYAGLLTFVIRQIRPGLPIAAAAVAPIIVAALLMWGYWTSWSPHAIKQLYVIHLLFALAVAFSGVGIVVMLVSGWFVKRRGLALGIAVAGTSFGSAALPPLNAALVGAFGWREGLQIDAAMPLVFLVLVFALVRGLPRHAGMTAMGQAADVGDLKQQGLTLGEAMRTKTYWAIAASGFLTYYSIFAIVQHLILYLTKSVGLSLPAAAQFLLVFSLIAFAAKLAGGAIADRIDRHLVFLGALVIMLAGCIGLATMRTDILMPSVAAIGLGWGALFTLYNMLAVSSFGLREIGRINGGILFFEALGTGLGSWLTGWLFDRYGDYRIAFMAIAVTVGLSLLIGTQTRRAPPA